MKALSIQQPFAALILTGRKRIEYRSWPAPEWLIGRRFAIHASQQLHPDASTVRLPLIKGAVLGTVTLRGLRGEPGDWQWLLADPVPLARPVPAKGRLRLWEWQR